MTDPTDFEQPSPGVRTFSLNSAYAHRLLCPPDEQRIALRVLTQQEIAREIAQGVDDDPDPSPRT